MAKQDNYTTYKDAKSSANEAVDNVKQIAKEGLSEVRKDLSALKSDTISLASHLMRDGKERASEVKEAVVDGYDNLRSKSQDALEVLADQVRENPRRSLLIAFAAGLVANMFLRSNKRD